MLCPVLMLPTLGACQPHHPLGMSMNLLSDVPLGMSVEKGQQVE